ncbi:hypothetical protein Rhe02_26110 [Rhizocola hellebori]|uniref:Polysaccharide biosynthesis protein n=1 Tax=Rhizocola hellebori TaxID=1392758 RepID=A0A8J3Q5Z8_9ACTN|nr:hypothetical protein [Rhizocola hellebori]GIH04544.1 hypothetical protein Rhe02_26110 [Rhizocola hellebori]
MSRVLGPRMLRRAFQSATLMYVSALAMSGLAILISVALPPDQRGLLVATITSAAVGVAIGGLSLETFLLAQGRPWLDETAGRRSLLLYAATVPISAGLGAAFAIYSGEASALLAAAGAALIAASNVPAAAGLSKGNFLGVYRNRALFAAIAPAAYGLLVVAGIDNAQLWIASWLVCQAFMAISMWGRYGDILRGLARRPSTQPERLTRMGLTHSGAVAQIFTYRFDQLTLARYQGADALAVYSLAIAAMEFSQAGAVVAAQRVLGDHDEGAQARLRKALGRALYLSLGLSGLALAGLWAIGLVTIAYQGAVVLGAILLLRTVAVVVGKILSARMVNLGGERQTAVIAAGTAVAAIALYPVVASRYGAWGIAVASVILFTGHTLATGTTLRLRSRQQPMVPAEIREEQGEFA